MTDSQQIVNKAWNFAHVLRDDGLSYMAYTEQITFLLFLKMAHEQTQAPYKRKPVVPPEFGWESLLKLEGDELEVHYRHTLEHLGKRPGMLGEIFKKARQATWTEDKPDGRWRSFDYDELTKRDKMNLDIFWLKDKSLEDAEDLPEPDVLAQEIADDLQTALDQFTAIAEGLKE